MSWTDRVVEYPNRVKLTAVSGQDNTFDMEAAEGTVYVEGTLLNAENLNRETIELISNALVNVVVEELIWNNPDYSANFNAQTVALDLSNYESIRVTWGQSIPDMICRVDGATHQVFANFNNAVSAKLAFATRALTPSSTGILFDDAYYKYPDAPTTAVKYNSWVKPQQIYGIRKL